MHLLYEYYLFIRLSIHIFIDSYSYIFIHIQLFESYFYLTSTKLGFFITRFLSMQP